MMEGIKKVLKELEKNPQQADLIVGYLSLCKMLKTAPEQVVALTWCSKAILSEYPLLALKLMKVALLLESTDTEANSWLQDILRSRGRKVSELRLLELSRTTVQTSATSHGVPDFAVMHRENETGQTAQPAQPPLQMDVPEISGAISIESRDVGYQQKELRTRFSEFLSRCGFSSDLERYAQGMSNNNCGLVTFVGVLQRLGLVKTNDMPLALMMLKKMIDENPDTSEALLLFAQLFEAPEPPARGEL